MAFSWFEFWFLLFLRKGEVVSNKPSLTIFSSNPCSHVTQRAHLENKIGCISLPQVNNIEFRDCPFSFTPKNDAPLVRL